MAGRFAFNTAIAAVMELTTRSRACATRPTPGAVRFALATAASLLFPFAPHTAADAYERLTGRRVWEEPWPDADPTFLERDTFELVCQVNGKVRDRVQAPAGAPREELERARAGRPERPGPRRRQEVVKVDRRARQARQRRRPLSGHPSAAPYVAVAGSGEPPAELLAAAEELGAVLAEAGAVVVTGGLGGMMEAACRGARSRLGQTLGILPGTDRADANGWVDVAVTTGVGELRNGLIVAPATSSSRWAPGTGRSARSPWR